MGGICLVYSSLTCDLSSLDANTQVSGRQGFTFVGSNAFSGAAGELRFGTQGSDTLIQADIDGDAHVDFEIILTGAVTPIAADFML